MKRTRFRAISLSAVAKVAVLGSAMSNQRGKHRFGLWMLRLIGQLIERRFGMTLSLPTLGKVMNQLGFTPQRPLHRAYKQDAVLVQRWLDNDLPALRTRAKARGVVVMFADEASMRSDYHAGTLPWSTSRLGSRGT